MLLLFSPEKPGEETALRFPPSAQRGPFLDPLAASVGLAALHGAEPRKLGERYRSTCDCRAAGWSGGHPLSCPLTFIRVWWSWGHCPYRRVYKKLAYYFYGMAEVKWLNPRRWYSAFPMGLPIPIGVEKEQRGAITPITCL